MDKQELSLMVIVGVLVVALVAVNTMVSSMASVASSAPSAEVTAYTIPSYTASGVATTSLVIYSPTSSASTMLTIK